MQSSVEKVQDVINSNKKYVVPAYQRPYRWDLDDAVQLVKDVYNSCQSQDAEYFIGSMICYADENGVFEVVDGQQRLVTLTLIFQQLGRVVENKLLKQELDRMILPVAPFNNVMMPTVKVRRQEREFYSNLIAGKENIAPNTVTEKVFYGNAVKIGGFLNSLTQEQLTQLTQHFFEKVLIVLVIADDRTSSFRLFNVLNTRGVPLNDADLIKNTLFESAYGNPDWSEQVEDQWMHLENLVGEKNLFDFFRYRIIAEKTTRDRTIKVGDSPASVYEYYEHQLATSFNNDPSAMLGEVVNSAQNYADILETELTDAARTIALLKRFKQIEWLPAFMSFLTKGHPQDEFSGFANAIEKVYMQSMLTGRTRDDACYHAIEAINQGLSVGEIIDCVHARADNAAFEQALDSTDFYDTSRRLVINLIKSVLICVDETYYEHLGPREYTKRISVEHILPQSRADKYWKDRFNEEQHQKWLHKLGNLTLLSSSMNAAAKNYGFDRKKEVYKTKSKKCPFGMTQELCESQEFDLNALIERHEKLKGEILDLWAV